MRVCICFVRFTCTAEHGIKEAKTVPLRRARYMLRGFTTPGDLPGVQQLKSHMKEPWFSQQTHGGEREPDLCSRAQSEVGGRS